MKPIDIVNEALNHNPPERTPVMPLIGLYSANLAQMTISDLLHDSAKQATAQLHALERFEYDGVITCMDLTAEAEVLGAEVVFQKKGFPYVKKHPYSGDSDLDKIGMPPIKDTRLQVFVDTTRKLVEAVGDSHLVSSYVIGPFTLAGHLLGVDSLLELTVEDPEKAIATTALCAELIQPYIDALASAGSHNIIILEPTASASIISPRFFKKFVVPSLSKLNHQIKSQGAFATLHICGQTTKILDEMYSTGASAISIDAAVDLALAINKSQKKAAVIGNVDTSLMLTGTPTDVLQEGRRCIERANTASGGHILSTGCDVPLETPIENVDALVRAARGPSNGVAKPQ
jgi:uroporphyrinogen decarboxylase